MKRFIKKAAATALLVAGIFSAVPPAFCAPYGMVNNTLVNGRGRLDGHSAMIIGKYFERIEDFQNLVMTNKKYRQIMEKYHYNPVEIDPEKQLAIFPKMETYRMEEYGSPNFVYTFPEGISRLLYLPGSFNGFDFKKIMKENGILDGNGKYNEDWGCYLDVKKDGFMDGFKLIFQSSDKEIVFLFDVCKDARLNCVKDCVSLMCDCGLDEFIDLFLDFFYIPQHVTSIGTYAFEGCNDLIKVHIPDSVTTIGRGAFDCCFSLERIVIPNSVKNLGERTFCRCSNLESITIPTSVVDIDDSVFVGCESLNHIEFGGNTYESVESFMRAFKAYREAHK